jgi:hypothetical protein
MRWLGLSFLLSLTACYAVPAEHEIPPKNGEDAGMDSEVAEPDAGEDDADAPEDAQPDGAKRDAQLDAALDAGKDAAPEAAQDAAGDASDASDAMVDANPNPCGSCPDSNKSVCLAASKTCVQCAPDAGGCAGNQLCAQNNTCVECLENKDCKSANASLCDVGSGKCVACVDGNDGQCTHITGKNVCSTGQCVECTKDKRSACKTSSSAPAVCETLKRQCTTRALAGAGACDECVSDAECATGHVCVMTTLGLKDVGYFCQPLRNNTCDQRPYVREVAGRTIDSTSSTTYCALARTSCTAIVQRGTGYQSNCGVTANGVPTTVSPVRGDDSLCGAANLDDGFCVSPGAGQYKCTVPCTPLSEAANSYAAPDCPNLAGPDPTCISQTHGTVTELLCSVN